jgi:hypothetical protein
VGEHHRADRGTEGEEGEVDGVLVHAQSLADLLDARRDVADGRSGRPSEGGIGFDSSPRR